MIKATKNLLGLLLLLLLLPMASAFAQPDLTVGSATGKPGDTVNTAVTFTNNGAVVGMSFDITYDSTKVTPGKPVNGSALGSHVLSSNVPTPGTLKVVIISLANAVMGSGELFTVPWTIAASATGGNVPLTLANTVLSDASAKPVTSGNRTSGQITITTTPATVTVPNVVGQTQAAAQTAITGAGLAVGTVTTQPSSTVPAGSVISQNPAAGGSVAAGSVVNLVVSSGAPAQVTVPNAVGQTQAAAQTAITGAGLTVGAVTTQPSTTVPAGSVISQNPAAGASVAAGSTVALVVSSGPPAVGAPIPTLSEWALLLLSLLLGGVVWRTHARRASFHA